MAANTPSSKAAPPASPSLPTGWKRAESRRFPGCYYYIRPDGSATWLLEGQTRKDLPRELQSIYQRDFNNDETLIRKMNPPQATATTQRHSSYAAHPKAPAYRDGEAFLSLKQRDFIPFASKPNYKPVHPLTRPTPFNHSSLYRLSYAPYTLNADGDVVMSLSAAGPEGGQQQQRGGGGVSKPMTVGGGACRGGAFAMREGGTEAEFVQQVSQHREARRLRAEVGSGDAEDGGATPRPPSSSLCEAGRGANQKGAPARPSQQGGRGRGGGRGLVYRPSAVASNRGEEEEEGKRAVPRPPNHVDCQNLNHRTNGASSSTAGDGSSSAAAVRRAFRARPKDMSEGRRIPFDSTTDYRAHFVNFNPPRPQIARPSDQVDFGDRNVFEGDDGGGGGDGRLLPSKQAQHTRRRGKHPNSIYRDDFKGEQPFLGKTFKAIVHKGTMKGIPSHYVSRTEDEYCVDRHLPDPSFRERMQSIDREVVRRLKETNSLGEGY